MCHQNERNVVSFSRRTDGRYAVDYVSTLDGRQALPTLTVMPSTGWQTGISSGIWTYVSALLLMIARFVSREK